MWRFEHINRTAKLKTLKKIARHLLLKHTKIERIYRWRCWIGAPNEGFNTLPAQRLVGRQTRTLLPTTEQPGPTQANS